MGAADTKKKDPKAGSVKKHKTKYPKVLYITALVGFVMAAWILIHQTLVDEPDNRMPKAPSQAVQIAIEDPSRYKMLLGRWQRPGGDYIIEINGVDINGALQAACFNPQPILVSKAYLTGQGPPVQLFIELMDESQPEASFALAYDQHNDTLSGMYYQPRVKQRFEVVFIRIN